MKNVIIALIAILFSINVAGQTPPTVIEFETLRHDFGTINEVDGEVKYSFKFKNIGTAPLVIMAVNASCGCTTPTWDKRPLAAGSSGTITIGFDPAERDGRFEKQIVILANIASGSTTLTIRGLVTPRPRTVVDDYPFVIDYGLRITDLNVSLGQVARGTTANATLAVINNSLNALILDVRASTLPAFIKVESPKAKLQAGEKSDLKISLDARKIDRWGDQNATFGLIINGQKSTQNIKIWATLVEDFSKLSSRELRDAPQSEYSTYFYHFSDQMLGARLTKDIYVSNAGVNDLIIRHVDFDSKKIKITTDIKTIKTGQTATLSVTLLDTATKGQKYQTLTIITNDPQTPVQEIRILATIK